MIVLINHVNRHLSINITLFLKNINNISQIVNFSFSALINIQNFLYTNTVNTETTNNDCKTFYN